MTIDEEVETLFRVRVVGAKKLPEPRRSLELLKCEDHVRRLVGVLVDEGISFSKKGGATS